MVGAIYVYVDTVFGFYVCLFFLNCLAGCLSMIIWTPVVLSVLYACVLYFCICTCSAQLSMFHMERLSRNTLIIIIIIIIVIIIIIIIITIIIIIIIIIIISLVGARIAQWIECWARCPA